MLKVKKRGRMMAFTVPDIVKTVEYRGKNGGMGKNGKEWMSLKVETLDDDSLSWEITVPQDLQGEVYRLGLKKGDYVQIKFAARYGMAQSGNSYGYLQLQRCPEILEVDEDGELK